MAVNLSWLLRAVSHYSPFDANRSRVRFLLPRRPASHYKCFFRTGVHLRVTLQYYRWRYENSWRASRQLTLTSSTMRHCLYFCLRSTVSSMFQCVVPITRYHTMDSTLFLALFILFWRQCCYRMCRLYMTSRSKNSSPLPSFGTVAFTLQRTVPEYTWNGPQTTSPRRTARSVPGSGTQRSH